MLSSDQRQIILKYKTFYQNIRSIKCPYFKNEPVFFNRKGFNHLLRKGRDPRAFNILIKRLSLLPYCGFVLTGSHTKIKYKVIKVNNHTAHFWGFNAFIDGKYMRLVVRQTNEGRKYFFSLFPIKH
ncbi:MAG: hypothetical protein AAB484_00420 [Patescibacteria group bacterium]